MKILAYMKVERVRRNTLALTDYQKRSDLFRTHRQVPEAFTRDKAESLAQRNRQLFKEIRIGAQVW